MSTFGRVDRELYQVHYKLFKEKCALALHGPAVVSVAHTTK